MDILKNTNKIVSELQISAENLKPGIIKNRESIKIEKEKLTIKNKEVGIEVESVNRDKEDFQIKYDDIEKLKNEPETSLKRHNLL